MVARRPATWKWMFDSSKKEHTYTYLYEREGIVEGYLLYHGGKPEETRLEEFITLTSRALLGLLGLLRRQEMQIEKFRWDAPPDDALWSALTHSDVETKLTTKHMARIVDLSQAFHALHPSPHLRGQLTLAVQDDSVSWNQGAWRVEIEDRRVEVTPSSNAPQVFLDIQALAQAYLGTPTVQELRAAGRIQVHDEASFRLLEALLAGPPAWCCDGF
jgi:predicted acetyltransferase